jgi:hypothetical protein
MTSQTIIEAEVKHDVPRNDVHGPPVEMENVLTSPIVDAVTGNLVPGQLQPFFDLSEAVTEVKDDADDSKSFGQATSKLFHGNKKHTDGAKKD